MSLTASSATGDASDDCDVAVDPQNRCLSVVTLTYDSQFVTAQRSAPGKSRQEIWIDLGAIVAGPDSVDYKADADLVTSISNLTVPIPGLCRVAAAPKNFGPFGVPKSSIDTGEINPSATGCYTLIARIG